MRQMFTPPPIERLRSPGKLAKNHTIYSHTFYSAYDFKSNSLSCVQLNKQLN